MDSKELAEIYRRYGHIVQRICREILRQEQDAQDAVHETFVKFWKFSEKLRNSQEFLSSLKRTAVSCAIDQLRTRKRQRRYQESWAEFRQTLQAEQQQKKQYARMQREIVVRLFHSVKVDEATMEMAYFYYMDDMTLEEVAQTTGFSRRAVGMKLERFRELALKYCRNHNIHL